MSLMRSLFAVLVLAWSARAHSMYQADVLLDVNDSGMEIELQLPQERIATALGMRITTETLGRQEAALQAYIGSGLSLQGTENIPFALRWTAPLKLQSVDGAPYVIAHLAATPASNSWPGDALRLQVNVLLDRIPNQVALVSVRSDWQTGIFANDPQLIAVLRGKGRNAVTIERHHPTWLRGFASVLQLGIRHIADGTDHLLFLLALLLPAPLLARKKHWNSPATLGGSLARILQVVTAFTIGHSITLALATLDVVRVPSRPIETLIAVSILVSAVHAVRPIFPGREPVIAASFGLIHGLAFATALSELGLQRWDRVSAIFSFNLGIELMQLAVVAAVLPSLLLLSRTPAYKPVRLGGASFAVLAACGWITERLFGRKMPIDQIVDAIASHAATLAVLLFLASASSWLLQARPWRKHPNVSRRQPDKSQSHPLHAAHHWGSPQ